MAKQKINVRLLRKIQAHILEEPRRLWMNGWGMFNLAKTRKNPRCGTMACIAGWAVVLNTKLPPQGDVRSVTELTTGPINVAAEKLLQITAPMARLLFWETDWPEEFLSAYQAARTARGRARAAVNRIDHFIKTNGAE